MNLLLSIGQADLSYARCAAVSSESENSNVGDYGKSYIVNQQGVKVKKFGNTRLRSLELIHCLFQRLFPGFGALVRAQVKLTSENGEASIPETDVEEIKMIRFLPL
jgi:hypothetical protein